MKDVTWTPPTFSGDLIKNDSLNDYSAHVQGSFVRDSSISSGYRLSATWSFTNSYHPPDAPGESSSGTWTFVDVNTH
jgi:hypothetical protein